MYIKIIAQQFYDYSLYFKGYSKATVKRYRQIINYYCKCACIEKFEEITDANIRAFFIHGRVEKRWKPTTFLIFHVSLGVFFRWCIENNYMSIDPIVDIEVPKLEKHLPSKLTKQDALKLLEVVYNYPYSFHFLRYRNHAVFAMMLFAGLRRSEIIHLRYTDVDIENLSIFVHQGKGSKDRIIPMSHTLAQSLKRYVEERKRLKKTCPEFFASLNRNTGFGDQSMKRLVVQMRKVSCIPFTSHKLRHTFATLMLEGGCDIYSLSKMMGHSDIKTTTIYLAASAEHLRAQMIKHPLNNLAI